MEGLINIKKYFKYLKRRFILNNYYTNIIKKGKNLQASFLDFVFMLIVLMMLFAIIVFRLTEDIFLTISIAFIIGLSYLFLLTLWNRRIRQKKILKINDEIADNELIKEIDKKDNREFLHFIKDILERYYNTTFYEYDRYIDFIGEINGEMYGLKCIKSPLDSKVTLKELEFFNKEIRRKNIKEGILVTNSYFSEDLKERTDYLLIDFSQIKKMLKEIGSYPTQKDIEDLIIARYENKKEMIKEKITSKEKSKVFKFILLGSVLILYSPFVSYRLYYRIMGFASIGIGLILGFYNVIKFIEGRQRET